MSLKQQIENIIALRKPQLPTIERKKQALDTLAISLHQLRQFLSENLSRVSEDRRPGVNEICNGIGRTMDLCRTQQSELEKIYARFNRDSLNIGVVGVPKMGKSTLLLSLSGLDGDVIPTGTEFMTGAASKIVNIPSLKKGEEYALITFHTEVTFLRDVVWPCWEDPSMGLSGFIPKPISIAQFKQTTLPQPPDSKDARAHALLHKLAEVQTKLPEFENLLGCPPQRIQRQDIRNYVAQRDSNNIEINNWRAVKIAEIFCAFPNEDAAHVTLLDTPGLGQLTIGLEAYVKETLGSEIDLAIMIINPSPEGGGIDDRIAGLYTLLGRALPDLETKDWTALAINKTPHNAGALPAFDDNLRQHPVLSFKAGVSHVDCKNPAETSAFFSERLSYLAQNITRLDQMYLDSRLRDLSIIHRECLDLLESIRSLFPESKAAFEGIDLFFNQEFEKVWNKRLGPAINNFVKRYRNESDEAGMTNLLNAFRAIDSKLRSAEADELHLESPEAIVNLPGQTLAWAGDTAQDLRTRFATHFEQLDFTLKDAFDEVRNAFWDALTGDDAGMLGKSAEFAEISNREDSRNKNDSQEKFEILSTVFADIPDGEALASYFSKAANFYPSYDAFMKHRIRKHLACLEEGTEEFEVNIKQWMIGTTELEVAKKTRDAFIQSWQQCRVETTKELRGQLAKEIQQAKFAFADELKSKFLHLGGARRAETRIKYLYERFKSQIWQEEYKERESDLIFQAQLRQFTNSVSVNNNLIK
jgi:hypothetical protein